MEKAPHDVFFPDSQDLIGPSSDFDTEQRLSLYRSMRHELKLDGGEAA